jgi:hypothetical protein
MDAARFRIVAFLGGVAQGGENAVAFFEDVALDADELRRKWASSR